MPATGSSFNSSRGISYLYMAAAFVVVVAGIKAAESIVNPLLLAVFLSVISAPAYFGLLKKNVSNWLALLIVIGVLSAVTLSVIFVMMESIASFSSRQEHYRELLDERTSGLQAKVEEWGELFRKKTPAVDAGTEADPASDEDSADDKNSADEASPSATSEVASPTAVEPAALDPTAAALTLTLADADDTEEQQPQPETDSDAVSDSEPLLSADGEVVVDADSVSMEPSDPVESFRFPKTRELPKDDEGWKKFLSEQFNPGMVISLAVTVLGSIGQLLSNAFLILLTVVFVLLEVGTFGRKIGDAFERTEETAERAAQIIARVQHYIVIKTWISLATGVFVVMWLKVLGVPYAGLWGLLAFFFNFIPNVGSVIAAIPAVLIAWLELTTLPAIMAAVGFVLVNTIVGNFVEPRLMGKSLGLSPLVVFFSMVFWGFVLGPVGMLLSVPLTMTARIAMEGFDDTRWVATLMGSGDSGGDPEGNQS